MMSAQSSWTAEAVANIPLSLYLHWPWCVRKCPYCDFNSHAAPADLAEREYVDMVLKDLEGWLSVSGGRRIETVFIGGGTPSLMSGDAVARLLEGADGLFGFTSDCEITLEANPGTVDEGRFRAFRDAGVNRVSVGVQSFMNEKLRKLGRIHIADEALRAASHAGEVFGNFNLDLMFALPGETLEEVAREVETAVATGATHLSFYQLTIEPGTAFAKRVPEGLPDDDLCADMSDLVIRSLEEAGFEHYEVSGYAGPGRRSRKYMASVSETGSGIAERRVVESEDLPFEFMLNTLRLTEGVPAELFEARTGLSLKVVEPILSDLRVQGLLTADKSVIRPTARGRAFLSDLQEAFL